MDFYDDLSDFEDCPTILMLKRERSRLRAEKYAACISKRNEKCFVIKKSLVTRDSRFSCLPRGQGVFTKVGGLHVIKFEGGVTTLKTKMTSLQSRYAIESGYDEDYVIVPAHDDIVSGRIHYSWKINHCNKHPTHVMCWCDELGNEHAYLEPMRHIPEDTEVTFKYF